MLNLIAAMDDAQGIGKNGKMPWHLPAEQQYFKKLTLGNTVIMGRITFEEIAKPLLGRENIVVTSKKITQCKTAKNLQQAILKATNQQIFVIGGELLFRQAMPLADRLYITHIHGHFDCDRFFPSISLKEFTLIDQQLHQDGFIYETLIYDRKK